MMFINIHPKKTQPQTFRNVDPPFNILQKYQRIRICHAFLKNQLKSIRDILMQEFDVLSANGLVKHQFLLKMHLAWPAPHPPL